MTTDTKGKPINDEDKIRAAALDYLEGYYTADVARMERALHPDLAKRAYIPVAGGEPQLLHMSALTLIQNTRNATRQSGRADIGILDRSEDIASVRAIATNWIDYMHLVKVGGDWKIINILWRLTSHS